MGSLEKLKQKLVRNPRNVRFSDLARVLRDLGYHEVRAQGSHHVFRPNDTTVDSRSPAAWRADVLFGRRREKSDCPARRKGERK